MGGIAAVLVLLGIAGFALFGFVRHKPPPPVVRVEVAKNEDFAPAPDQWPKVALPKAAIVPPGETPHPKLTGAIAIPDPPFAVDPRLKDAKERVHLSDMQEFAVTGGPMGWKFAKNGDLGNSYEPQARVIVKGQAIDKSVSTHPPWNDCHRVCYALGKQAKKFAGAVAINDTAGPFSPPTRFAVLGDGKVLWTSSALKGAGQSERFDLDVREVAILELRTCTDQGIVTQAHAVWLDPYVQPH